MESFSLSGSYTVHDLLYFLSASRSAEFVISMLASDRPNSSIDSIDKPMKPITLFFGGWRKGWILVVIFRMVIPLALPFLFASYYYLFSFSLDCLVTTFVYKLKLIRFFES